MSLSRLDRFLSNPTGVVLYVDPGNFDATDSIENRGNSPSRPFSSIQRCLIESARYSFQQGRNNDRNDRTTILVAPGTHYIDNRPGFSIENISGQAVYKKRTGKDTWTVTNLEPLGENSNFDIFDPNNDLYKYNSVYGGLILPRGTSIVGQDLRKTKIRPLYVPDPIDLNIERSSIFNVTGGCYFREFTFFDADPTKFSYKNYSDTRHVPKYSHHKLTTFVYADGVNPVRLGLNQTVLTDLDMYYYKITKAYNNLSGRDLVDYPTNIDFEPTIDEYRIVGALQENPLGITSIRAGNGDGTGDNSIITVTTANLQTKIEEAHNFAIDTPIIIKGVTESSGAYNGSFTVREVIGINTFTYITTQIPSEVLPDSSTFEIATVSVESDTVSSASPYIFSCSLRSVYGMCGMWADGSKADGFKSMVVAQFTGISLQKDDDAYLIYDNGTYYDNITLPEASPLRPLYQNSRAIFKPEFENFHVKCSNDAFIQAVSVFAIGYAKHFLTESGADMSITNSNSNFGANALNSVGFRKVSFNRDDTGFITHIIPPRELSPEENEISWLSLDIVKIQTIANPKKLYLFGFNSKDIAPVSQVESYRVGARVGDKIFLTIAGSGNQTTYSSPIYMTTPGGTEGLISRKEYKISRTGNVNNISTNTITLSSPHTLFTGEKIRIFSDNAQAPDNLIIDKVYYAITDEVDNTLANNQIKLALTLNDAESNIALSGFGSNGGIITILSTVSDKFPGDPGHPVQWDEVNQNWYLNTSQFDVNQVYNVISSLNPSTFGSESPTTFIRRVQEIRPIEERLYKLRYVIPKEYINAKEPQVGYILQESKNVAITTTTVTEGASLLNSTELRNEKIIINANTGSITNNTQVVTITTELPHNLIPGDIAKIQNITSVNNPTGSGIVSTFNGEYEVISIPSSRTFTYRLENVKVNPGSFTNQVNQRTTRQQRDALPYVSRQSYKNNFYIYRVETIRDQIPGNDGQDGVYHLTVMSSTVGIKNNVGYGLSEKYFNQDVRNLYPQVDNDNSLSNPGPSISYADLSIVGKVITDDKKKSITLEALHQFTKNTRIGFGITNVSVSGVGNTTLTLFTDVEHKLNSIKSVSFISNGSGYPANFTFYSRNLVDLKFNEEDATCKVSTTSGGEVNPNTFRLVDVGTAHTVGERLGIQGGTLTNAIVEVNEINNNIGDGLELSGFNSTNINGVYEIINVPNKKSIVIHIPEGISQFVPNTIDELPFGYIASNGVDISSFNFTDISTGIVTVTTSGPHGLFAGNKIKVINSNLNNYNKDFIVSEVVGLSTFTFNVGVGIATTTTTPSRGKILKYGITSNALTLGRGEENLASRACYIYSGLETTVTGALSINTSTLNVSNAKGITRGDFLQINNEILRVSTFPIGNTLSILRNQLGTVRTTASSGTVIRKIKVIPTETRRPSFMRASGHTFEYLGFGPGNYSTALPQRQDRVLEEIEVLVSQAKKEQGGSIVYTGMNDLGEFYTGSKKISATTGEETIIDAPVLTFTGDDADGEIKNRQNGLGIFDGILVKNRITVEGGENGNQGSQFYGPVSFNKKLTNLSPDGILTRNLFIRGTVAQEKLFTVGISTPTSLAIPNPINGDISFISNPVNNYIGHVYKANDWRQWGLISNTPNELSFTVDKIGIGVSPTNTYALNVAGTTQLQNLRVTGGVVFTQAFNLGDVKFEDIDVYGTATFLGINPSNGVSTTYTQIHESGTSLFNQVEAIGISTFYKDVYVTKAPTIGAVVPTLYPDRIQLPNIRVGIANSNTIDTRFGDLILGANSNRTRINTNVSIDNGNIAITSTRSSGVATAYIKDSSVIRLGVGNTNQTSYIDFNNDSSIFPDFGLRLTRNPGIGSQSSALIHRGIQPLIINAFDSADVRILSNNTERIRVGASGTITSYYNNSGENLNGGHFRLTQNGPGDVALSWDITHNNANRRWYAGIDTSDGYSWKLANPSTLLAYGNENFDSDTKIKINVNGELTLTTNVGISTVDATNLVTSATSFNLLNTNVSTANLFGDAETINIAKQTLNSRVNINGITESNNINSGALVVSGGVGVAKNLNVGGNITLNGNVTLGNSNVNTVTFNSRINSNVLPSTSNNLNIGSLENKWNNIHANNFVGAVTNIKGGTSAQIPYQTASDVTGFIPNGTSGQLLQSNGTSPPSWVNPSSFDVGTRLMFAQASAPTGWTRVTDDSANDRMLRVISSGGGGGTGGSATPILNNVVPSHTHSFTTGGVSANHTHTFTTGTVSSDHSHNFTLEVVGSAGNDIVYPKFTAKSNNNYGGRNVVTSGISANHVHGGTTDGFSNNHTHSGSTDNGSSQTNWSPRYINMILCSKN